MPELDLGYDPRLKEAMAEIAAVLQKHDVGGFVHLASETHAEFRLFITPPTPSWSVCKWTGESDRFVFQMRKNNPEGTELTAHLLFTTRDTLIHIARGLVDLTDYMEENFKIEHKPFHGLKFHGGKDPCPGCGSHTDLRGIESDPEKFTL